MQDRNQILLIISGIVVTALFGIFTYREMFPEYKIYQQDYIELEKFRSTYTHVEPIPFQIGVKQIVLERDDKGPAIVDRCTSCHVALQAPYFSPTKLAHDINGNIIRNEEGIPLKFPNEEYIWAKLDQKIAELRDEKVNEQLQQEGQTSEVKNRLKEAERYGALKVAHVGEHEYDVVKVLSMHPLIGKETRPFEFHPIEEYGCTSCHNGNGRGLVTDKAHGPVIDGMYEAEFEGRVPKFTETDPENDPLFSRVFNSKPGHKLIFQTQPLYVGSLIQAKCMNCHQTSQEQFEMALLTADKMSSTRGKQFKTIQDSFENDKRTVIGLLSLRHMLLKDGFEKTNNDLQKQQQVDFLSKEERENLVSHQKYFDALAGTHKSEEDLSKIALNEMNKQLLVFIGSQKLIDLLQSDFDKNGKIEFNSFIKSHQSDSGARGILFVKAETIDLQQDLIIHAQESQESFESTLKNTRVISGMQSDIDSLTANFQRGKDLYLSQACYACHRISGLARGGVGPELTRIGEQYPWYIKQSIVWPQADLKSSTMPNMRLDHDELEDLMTFLLAQNGGNKSVSQMAYQDAVQSWESGRKLPWEKPISPTQMRDLRYSMTTFATEGCASCHRLMGYESNVGFKVEKENPSDFNAIYEQQQWFKSLFPETVNLSAYEEVFPGSSIVERIKSHEKEIDERIVHGVRENAILEEIEALHPLTIESFYSNFKFAARAREHEFKQLLQTETDPHKRELIEKEEAAWKDRVHRVLMMYIQSYGLGRLIGPKPNWSGIYRTDEWLMEHFRNPGSHVARSIMPIMPFDDTKFYALTYMLDVLGIRNRNAVRAIWEHRGFDPREAFNIHCAQCHGHSRVGNGIISEWIYPIPKNLLNPDFLRNLTKEQAIASIKHGVTGTPMPPWGEVAQDKPDDIKKMGGTQPVLTQHEITRLVDWLFESLPGGEVIKETHDVPKWNYQIQDVIKELRKGDGGLSASSDVFDVGPSLPEDPTRPSYYIKKQFYTPYNIQEGQQFFLLNCAVCHGNEGDGSGARGVAMREAKPRMLTNLDWIHSRDDLRLLRSIKYGVAGTSMTPWGDFTNSLQRLQLVMFIRSLSREQDRRDRLNRALYQAFDTSQNTIEEARVAESEKMKQYERQKSDLKKQRIVYERLSDQGDEDATQKAIDLYKASFKVDQELDQAHKKDMAFLNLKEEVKKERLLYLNLGMALINKNFSDEILDDYYKIITLNDRRYNLENDQLKIQINPKQEIERKVLQKKLIDGINAQIESLKANETAKKLQVSDSKNIEEIKALQAELTSYEKLKERILIDLNEATASIHVQIDKLGNMTHDK